MRLACFLNTHRSLTQLKVPRLNFSLGAFHTAVSRTPIFYYCPLEGARARDLIQVSFSTFALIGRPHLHYTPSYNLSRFPTDPKRMRAPFILCVRDCWAAESGEVLINPARNSLSFLRCDNTRAAQLKSKYKLRVKTFCAFGAVFVVAN
jgi:hypothetical protein